MVKIFKASKQTQTVGQLLTFTIERLDSNGLGVAYFNGSKNKGNKSNSATHQSALDRNRKELNKGKPVFIAGVLPGEKVTVKIVEQKSKYLQAKLIEVLQQSSERRVPFCKHTKQCGGCDIQHLSMDSQIAFKRQKISDLFSRQGFQALPWQQPIKSKPFNYRRKARIGVQYSKKGEPIVGFRKRLSNDLTPIKQCDVLAHGLEDIFPKLKSMITELTLSQSVGHVEVYSTEHINIVIRQLKKLNEADVKILMASQITYQWRVFIDDGKKITPLMDNSFYTIEQGNNNTKETYELSYLLHDNINIKFRASDFIQINHQVNLNMVSLAIEWLELSKQDHVLDLFCGLGNFSLSMAQQVASVTGVEGVSSMTEQAQLNARLNNLDNCQFFHADLNAAWSNQSWAEKRFTKVLLDPARAGAYEACEQLLTLRPSHIVYVSCEPSTLARDSKLLVDNGYQMKKISLIDMFSQTKHVETMVLFQRK